MHPRREAISKNVPLTEKMGIFTGCRAEELHGPIYMVLWAGNQAEGKTRVEARRLAWRPLATCSKGCWGLDQRVGTEVVTHCRMPDSFWKLGRRQCFLDVGVQEEFGVERGI